jgi:hypothetical protein
MLTTVAVVVVGSVIVVGLVAVTISVMIVGSVAVVILVAVLVPNKVVVVVVVVTVAVGIDHSVERPPGEGEQSGEHPPSMQIGVGSQHCISRTS